MTQFECALGAAPCSDGLQRGDKEGGIILAASFLGCESLKESRSEVSLAPSRGKMVSEP